MLRKYFDIKNYIKHLQYLFYLGRNEFTSWKRRWLIERIKTKYGNKKIIQHAQINQLEIEISVFANTSIGQQILAFKQYEPNNTIFLKKFVKKNWVCFDIGGNIGYYTLLLAKLSPGGKIYSFEPNQLDFCLLKLNVLLNNFNNVYLNNFALSDKNGTSRFYITQDSGLSSLRKTHRAKVKKISKVKTQTLDNYILKRQIKKVDFIKIDVEGAEKMVLGGAKKTLKNLKPKLLQIEICPQNLRSFNQTPQLVIDYLERFDYQPFRLINNRLVKFTNKFDFKNLDLFFLNP